MLEDIEDSILDNSITPFLNCLGVDVRIFDYPQLVLNVVIYQKISWDTVDQNWDQRCFLLQLQMHIVFP